MYLIRYNILIVKHITGVWKTRHLRWQFSRIPKWSFVDIYNLDFRYYNKLFPILITKSCLTIYKLHINVLCCMSKYLQFLVFWDH